MVVVEGRAIDMGASTNVNAPTDGPVLVQGSQALPVITGTPVVRLSSFSSLPVAARQLSDPVRAAVRRSPVGRVVRASSGRVALSRQPRAAPRQHADGGVCVCGDAFVRPPRAAHIPAELAPLTAASPRADVTSLCLAVHGCGCWCILSAIPVFIALCALSARRPCTSRVRASDERACGRV
jgi:hypothetical protein